MTPEGIYFDAASVALDIAIIESFTLTKTASNRPEPFILLPPHRKLVANLLGWKRADGTRLYRRCYFSVARKNAKTQIAAALGLLLLISSTEQEPEIYIAAKDRDQAGFCFSAVMKMVLADPELRDALRIVKSAKEIHNEANGGILKALSSEGESKHGSNPSAVIFDEFHVWGNPERELYDALTTGSVARIDPLELIITTAGVDEYSMCGKEYDYARKVLNGTIQDTAYLPLIYEVAKDADWSDEREWAKANPTLGKIVQIDKLREIYTKALNDPAELTKFKRLNCNMWVNSSDIWIILQNWDACSLKGSDPILATAGSTLQPSQT